MRYAEKIKKGQMIGKGKKVKAMGWTEVKGRLVNKTKDRKRENQGTDGRNEGSYG